MSEQNGDRARFQKNRKRKLRRRQRVQALLVRMRTPTDGLVAVDTGASNGGRPPVQAMPDEGSAVRTAD
jgi:hypothetical protein